MTARTDSPRITPEVWRSLALSDAEYHQIVELLGREPSIVELGMFGAMWSEHCGYKHSRPLFPLLRPRPNLSCRDRAKTPAPSTSAMVWPSSSRSNRTTIRAPSSRTRARRPVSAASFATSSRWAPGRSRFLIRFDLARWTQSATAICSATSSAESATTATASASRTSAARSSSTSRTTGTRSSTRCASAWSRSRQLMRARASGIGNIVMIIGADTGRDGLHGATFASVEDPEASHRGVVQVGNPFLEKLLLEACLELLQGDDVVAMQDLGAAGLTSSSVECAARGGVGIEIDVAKVPRREPGLTPFEVMLSESQERMLLVVRPEGVERVTRSRPEVVAGHPPRSAK